MNKKIIKKNKLIILKKTNKEYNKKNGDGTFWQKKYY